MKIVYGAKILTCAAFATALTAGCAGTDLAKFKTLGSSVLSSTGYVSGSSADALFDSGAKLQKGLSGFTEQEEYYLGRGVSALILSKYKTVNNSALTNYVNQVGAVLVSASERPFTYGGYHFVVLDSDEINAISAPGGFIFITRGLLKLCPNEEALSAVLAHEVAHVVFGHARESISQSNISDAILSAAKDTAKSQGGFYTSELTALFGDSIQEIGDKLLVNGFSRSQEYRADEYAQQLATKVGYDAHGLQTVLLELKKAEAAGKGGWLSTHPAAEDRLDELDLDEFPASTTASARLARFNSATKGYR